MSEVMKFADMGYGIIPDDGSGFLINEISAPKFHNPPPEKLEHPLLGKLSGAFIGCGLVGLYKGIITGTTKKKYWSNKKKEWVVKTETNYSAKGVKYRTLEEALDEIYKFKFENPECGVPVGIMWVKRSRQYVMEDTDVLKDDSDPSKGYIKQKINAKNYGKHFSIMMGYKLTDANMKGDNFVKPNQQPTTLPAWDGAGVVNVERPAFVYKKRISAKQPTQMLNTAVWVFDWAVEAEENYGHFTFGVNGSKWDGRNPALIQSSGADNPLNAIRTYPDGEVFNRPRVLKKKRHKKKATGACALMLQFGVFTYETNAQAEKGDDVVINPPVAGVPPTELDASSAEETGSGSAEEASSAEEVSSAEDTGSASASASSSAEEMTPAPVKTKKKKMRMDGTYNNNKDNRKAKCVGLTKAEYDAGVRTD